MIDATVNVVADADGTCEVACDVGVSGTPFVGGLTLLVQCNLVAFQTSQVAGFHLLAILGGSAFKIDALACRQCIVDGHNNLRQRHTCSHSGCAVSIGVLLEALQVEAVAVALYKQGGTILIGNGTCLIILTEDVVDNDGALFIGYCRAADTEVAVAAAFLFHGE